MELKVKRVSEPTTKNAHPGSTHLKVSVMHLKERKAFILDATPIKRDGDVVSFGLCSGTCIKIEDTPRANKKRVTQLEEQAERQIAAKSGQAWDLVRKVLTEHGLDLDQAAA